MSETATVDVLFPLRAGTVSELGRFAGKEPISTLRRFPAVDPPAVCVAHGRPGTWSRRFYVYAKPETEFDRWSSRRQIWHDLTNKWAGLGRLLERVATAHQTRRTIHGCDDCHRWLRAHRGRGFLRLAVSLFVMIGLPVLLADTEYGEAAVTLLVPGAAAVVYSLARLRWAERFSRVSVTDHGEYLVVHAPHPDYVAAATATGAETRATRGFERAPWWRVS
ncbi:hypothetical protein [Rhodococcus sp. HNM0569]|uniref:hypothetical protein n=1 Tax=Rhodococcus sp. HNM0569 TaxID=2716340 RepID=UPI00146ABC19|nr:hypothetical protein [Rhodococcus sp. HNM0569]NLU83619.1 hypothetical protein [Rhodococcus sp. HNM0569]